MSITQCSIKKYKVILEYLNINVIAENLDWQNKQLFLDEKIELIPINIKHLYRQNKLNENQLFLPDIIIKKPALEYIDIIEYWNNIDIDIILDINIKKLKVGKDYYIIPLYLINNILILGIVILGTPEYINTKEYKIIHTFNLLSIINKKIFNSTNNKLNIIQGILNNPINLELLKNIYIQEHNIKWLYIFRNIVNYLPKFEIIIKQKKKKVFINFFQNRLNP
jgi:hypothetical protein